MKNEIEVKVDCAQRLDAFLVEKLLSIQSYAGITRAQVKRWIEEGHVSIAGQSILKAGYALKPGQIILVRPPAPEASDLEPYAAELKVVFEDEYLIIVDKAAGVSMHPGAGNRKTTLANMLVHRFGSNFKTVGPVDRPGIVHRLDKDTTGLVIVAKDAATLAAVSRQFASREVKKVYLALCHTGVRGKSLFDKSDQGEIRGNIGRHPKERKKMAVMAEGGKAAVTRFNVLERSSHAALVEFYPETGRTHQIRVQAAHVGAPLLGDMAYGKPMSLPEKLKLATQAFGRHALHAARIAFVHPQSGQLMDLKCPPPADFSRLKTVFFS